MPRLPLLVKVRMTLHSVREISLTSHGLKTVGGGMAP